MTAQDNDTEPKEASHGRVQGELDDIDDCAELGRQVKCRLEQIMDYSPNTVVTVDIEVNEVGHHERR